MRASGRRQTAGFPASIPSTVSLDGKIYKCAEAYMLCKRLDPEYQNRLFNHDDLCNQIRAAPTVQDAQQIANRSNAFRQDWATLQYFFGLKVVNAKFKDNEGLKHSLVATGKRKLVYENSDPFWGTGPDGQGQNKLGEVLENVRKRMKTN